MCTEREITVMADLAAYRIAANFRGAKFSLFLRIDLHDPTSKILRAITVVRIIID